MAVRRKNNRMVWAQRAVLVAYVLFMVWVIYWKANYHPDVYLSMDKWWEHPGESANRTTTMLEALNGR